MRTGGAEGASGRRLAVCTLRIGHAHAASQSIDAHVPLASCRSPLDSGIDSACSYAVRRLDGDTPRCRFIAHGRESSVGGEATSSVTVRALTSPAPPVGPQHSRTLTRSHRGLLPKAHAL